MSGTIIKIKYSGSTAEPTANTLAVGELAYSFNSDKLFIGDNTATANVNDIIGGKYFTDKLDHALGTLTANSAILVDASKKIDVLNVDNITLDLNTISTTNANGHLILNPNGAGEVQIQADLAVIGGVTINGTAVLAGATTLGNINITSNTISAVNTNGDIILTPNGTGDVNILSTQTLGLPRGTDAQRPAQSTALNGAIRYNTSDNRFEGVANGAWTGLGGVVDVDQDTFITAEKTADDDHLRFMVGPAAGGTEKATINGTGFNIDVINELTTNAGILLSDNVKIGTTSVPANLILSGNLTVEGTTTTVESTIVSITDHVMELSADSPVTVDTFERGVNFKYGDGAAIQTGFFGMDMGSKRFSFQSVKGSSVPAGDNQFASPWGDAQFNSLFLSGNNTVTGNSTIGGTFGVTGATTLSSTLAVTGATTLSSTLGVTGVTTLAALLNANGGINCDSGKFIVADTSGNVSTQGTLTVTGATVLSSTLAVTGVTTLTALLNANGGINCDSGKFIVADTSGNVSTAGTLNVTGAVDFDSTLNVDGAVTHKSTTALGSTGQMVIDAAGVMTAGTIDCGTF